MKGSLRSRIEWHLKDAFERVVLALGGRPVACAACGRRLFVALPFLRHGRLRLFGAAEHEIRVAFSNRDELEFRHALADECPAPERPWVR